MGKASTMKVALIAILLVIGFVMQLSVEGRVEKGGERQAMVGRSTPLMDEEPFPCKVVSDCPPICHGCLADECTDNLCVYNC